MKKSTSVIIGVLVALLGFSVLINAIYNNNISRTKNNNEITSETTMSNINSNEPQKTSKKVVKTSTKKTTKKSKKVVKTTKKATTKKTTKKTIKKKTNSKIHIKYNRKEIENYVYQEVVRRWGEEHWISTYNIISHESGFNPNSWNKKNTACGLFQAKPCKKTIKNGYKDYYTNWKTQVIWGLDYISYKYKNPNNAWKYWQKHHSY